MELLEKIEKQRVIERIMASLRDRRYKTDPLIRIVQMCVIAADIAENKLNLEDLSEATKGEKEELKDIFQRWAET